MEKIVDLTAFVDTNLIYQWYVDREKRLNDKFSGRKAKLIDLLKNHPEVILKTIKDRISSDIPLIIVFLNLRNPIEIDEEKHCQAVLDAYKKEFLEQ